MNEEAWSILNMRSYTLILHSPVIYIILSLPLGTVISWLYYQLQSRQRNMVLRQGVRIEGTIIRYLPKRFHYYLLFSYEYEGSNYIQKQSVYPVAVKEVDEGTKISVYCLPLKPEKSVLADFDTYFASHRLTAVGLTGSAVILAGLAIMIPIALFLL